MTAMSIDARSFLSTRNSSFSHVTPVTITGALLEVSLRVLVVISVSSSLGLTVRLLSVLEGGGNATLLGGVLLGSIVIGVGDSIGNILDEKSSKPISQRKLLLFVQAFIDREVGIVG